MNNSNPVSQLFSGDRASLLQIQLQKIIDLSISRAFIGDLEKIKGYRLNLEHPKKDNYGDYSTNIAIILGARLVRPPGQVAQQISDEINDMIKKHQTISVNYQTAKEEAVDNILEKSEIAGSGFLNLWLSEAYLINCVLRVLNTSQAASSIQKSIHQTIIPLQDRKILVEFAHPNTHKEFHIGHLRNISLGESLVRLLEQSGSEVFRANYQGDVGLHVAKAIWGVKKKFKVQSSKFKDMEKKTFEEKAKFLGEGYALGSRMYDEDEGVKKEIIDLNKSIYTNPHQVELWEETRSWSLEYFDHIYKRLGSRFDRLFFESAVEEEGRRRVIKAVEKGIFIKDADGSIYFPGEKVGLNSCVFVTRENYATYEGKEVALEDLEYQTYPFDRAIHVVASEQRNFFQIAFAAVEQLYPSQKGKQYHLPYGMVNLKQGKMSSRTGKVITADQILNTAKKKILRIIKESKSKDFSSIENMDEIIAEIAEKTAVGAVKYAMLKVSPRADIAFDLEESVTFDGDSGPYLLYTYARCQSVLRKAGDNSKSLKLPRSLKSLNPEELSLLRAFYRFEEVIYEAVKFLSPSLVCAYLFDLAQKYNNFYSKHKILYTDNKEQRTDNREDLRHPRGSRMFRLFLTQATSTIIKEGLYLLGIETVERM